MIYRGRTGMWSWILHRVTGAGVMLFLFFHVLDTFPVLLGPKIYDAVLSIYVNPLFKLGEVALVAALVFHSLNGIRLILVDLLPEGARHEAKMFRYVVGAFGVIMLPTALVMLRGIWRGHG